MKERINLIGGLLGHVCQQDLFQFFPNYKHVKRLTWKVQIVNTYGCL